MNIPKIIKSSATDLDRVKAVLTLGFSSDALLRWVFPDAFSFLKCFDVWMEEFSKIAFENNRFFPLSLPSESSCTIGGNISTNAGGAAVLKYGMTKELVEGIEVVLPNGEIINSIKNIEKDNRGFDPKYLHIGSEGTLGIITKVKIRLFPEIKKKAMAIVATNSIKNLIKNNF